MTDFGALGYEKCGRDLNLEAYSESLENVYEERRALAERRNGVTREPSDRTLLPDPKDCIGNIAESWVTQSSTPPTPRECTPRRRR